MKLSLNETFLNYFRDNLQLVNNKTFEVKLRKELSKNKATYGTVIDILEDCLNSFKWIEFSKLRLQYSKEIEKDDLQIYLKEKSNYNFWKEHVRLNYGKFQLLENEIEDQADFDFNYKIRLSPSFDGMLYTNYNDIGYIVVGYDKIREITYCILTIELRKELFKMFDFNDNINSPMLSERELKQNTMNLKHGIFDLLKKNYKLESSLSLLKD
jgi:hypothetical protein